MRRTVVRFRITVLLTLMSLSSGCTQWAARQPAPVEILASEHPDKVKIVTASGEAIEVHNPEVRGDSVIGLLPNTGVAGQPLARFSMPLSDVRGIATQRRDAARTIALAAGVPIAAALAVFLLAF